MSQRIRDKSASFGLLLARIPMGAFFLIAGYHKMLGGVGNFAHAMISYVPASVPQGLGSTYLHAVPFLEIAVGVLLILGLLGRLAALIGALMVISFTVGLTGIHEGSLPFHPNMIYLGLLLGILFAGPGKISVDGLIFGRRPRPAPLEPNGTQP